MSEDKTPAGPMSPGLMMLADHVRLDDLFNHLLTQVKMSDADEFARVWSEFEEGVLNHLSTEEAFLFPLFARGNSGEVKALKAEHDRIRVTMMELGMSVDLHTTRAGMVERFVELLRAHATREEAALYRWAETGLPEGSFEALKSKLSRTFKPKGGH